MSEENGRGGGEGFDARRYWDRRLERDWSLQAVGVRTLSHSYNRWLYRVRRRAFRRAVAVTDLRSRPAPEVLDVGAGVGFYVSQWKHLGGRVTAVDIADSAARRLAIEHPDVRVHRLDVADDVADLPGGYDAVSAFDVLFHVVDDARYRRAVQNLAGLLRPGGWFLFTETMSSRRTQAMKHYVRRSRTETLRALRAAGLEVVSMRPAFALMTYPFDAEPRWRERWKDRVAPVARGELGGFLLGALLFAPELVLTRVRTRGPSTHLVVCRKPPVGR